MAETTFARAIVMQQDPGNGGLIVMLPTFGQVAGTGVSVKILYHGAADGIRVKQASLPERGTWGLVIFPSGNIKDGFWVGSYFPNLGDALSVGPKMGDVTTDPNAGVIEYHSHWSGFWSYLDGSGTMAAQWPESSSFVAGNSGLVPTVFRHTVDEGQNRTQQEVTMADRVPTPPANFTFKFHHNSGTTITIDPSGNVDVTTAPNANFTLETPSGLIAETAQKTITLTATGDIKFHTNANMIVEVGGNLSATVSGSATVAIAGNAATSIGGSATVNVTGGLTATVGGTAQVNATGAINLTSSSSVNVSAPSIHLN